MSDAILARCGEPEIQDGVPVYVRPACDRVLPYLDEDAGILWCLDTEDGILRLVDMPSIRAYQVESRLLRLKKETAWEEDCAERNIIVRRMCMAGHPGGGYVYPMMLCGIPVKQYVGPRSVSSRLVPIKLECPA